MSKQEHKHGCLPHSLSNTITVLSIDGGGVRGIIPSVMLEFLESELQKLDGEHVRLADYFDAIVGTSTGGLVATMLTAPDDNNRPLFEAKEIPTFYKTECPKIFPQKQRSNLFHKGLLGLVMSRFGIVEGPRYDGDHYLHHKVKEVLGNKRISETLTEIVIPTFDIRTNQAVIFSKSETKSDVSMDAYLSDVCISTSAAPTFFPPHQFTMKDKNDKEKKFNLIDGGVIANNPAFLAIWHLRKAIFEHRSLLVISLGTGRAEHHDIFTAHEASKWDDLHWIVNHGKSPLIDALSIGTMKMIEKNLADVMKAAKWDYLRVQDDTLPDDASSMDLATEENLLKLQEIGENLLKKPARNGKVIKNEHVETNKGTRDGMIDRDEHVETNEEALRRFAVLLSEERKLRCNKLVLNLWFQLISAFKNIL